MARYCGRTARTPGEYVAWLDRFPVSLQGSAMAEALQAVADLELEAPAAIEPSRGYARD